MNLRAFSNLRRNYLRNSASDVSESSLAFWLLLPAVLLLALIVVYPVAKVIHDSFYSISLFSESGPAFVGFSNYVDAMRDPDVWRAVRFTIALCVVTVPGALLVGLGLALLANREWKWRWPVRLALLLPWAIPLAFSGMIFAWFFNTEYGVVNDLLRRAGFAPISFLLIPQWSFLAICIATIWKTSSFVALILLAGLQTIPRSLYEAAALEGASRWQIFRHVTLPLLMPAMMIALIFRTISALQSFDIPYAMTQGGPARYTETLSILINTTAIEYMDVGYGSALAVLLFLLSMAISSVYLRKLYKGAL
ncbi:carbohydrate ABC transporter permease [Methylobacillus flagellatus]|uniref:Carbohydrate ABC transporter membrane protein 1, CUT1 family n=1 Tax=Methylobacillus flagellatus (strain ATCC 51484 / DSM 6875 / VKM B-1610 / KT) TaxID=265072 RepID=Q1GYS1_METFK|nr:sugar ABC transporter permease [Methylobacillus flagellatus]ABE50616.1 carbohydrate ABC transporter membrane protein 1, CUT1 family [Methylobacillus flagellatus KT]